MTTVSSSTSNSSSSSSSSSSSLSSDPQQLKNQFLKILMTQLQNQNPLDPMKPEQFSSQLAQFSQLEQQIDTNTKLDSLITAASKTNVSPLSYLNTTIDYLSDTAPVQGGKANWTYLATGADKITLQVQDASGNTIYTADGSIASGAQSFSYPTTLADGTSLKLVVTATKSDGSSVTSTVNSKAKITAVNTVDGSTILEADGFFIDESAVSRVTSTPTTPTA